jgi:hypothetical protein
MASLAAGEAAREPRKARAASPGASCTNAKTPKEINSSSGTDTASRCSRKRVRLDALTPVP